MPDPVAVNSMFGRIAHRYDLANLLLSGGIDTWWRRRLVAAVRRQHPRKILDLATGSGDVAFALCRGVPTAQAIVGADFCRPMIDQAEAKKRRGVPNAAKLTFAQADILGLPMPDDTYDAITIAFGLRNLANRVAGLTEMRRVLRPGGRLFVLEFSQPQRWIRSLYFFYLQRVLPPLAGIVTGDRAAYVYLNKTISEFPDRAALSREITSAGFASVRASSMTFGIVALHEATK